MSLLSISCGQRQDRVQAVSKPSPPPIPGEISISSDSPKLQEIKVAVVGMADVPTDEVIAPGKIEVNPNRVSRVVLPVSGRITQVMTRLGDAVQQGQPILEIESPDADAALSVHLQAVASVNQAKANLSKAQADLERVKDLFEHNAVAKKELLNAENAVAQSQAILDQAEASIRQALRKIEILGLTPNQFGQKVVVRAPLAGKVLELSVAAGEYRNDTTQPLVTIADLSSVWIASDVPENMVRFIQVGEHIELELAAYPNETFHARVKQVADVMDPQTRTLKVRAELDNSRGRLRPEMFGRIRHVESMEKRPVVPIAAVVQGDTQSVVYLQTSPGVFKITPVKVGNPAQGFLPILSGLKAGDTVVIDGVMLLKGL